MKTFVMRVDTAREQRDRHFSVEKPILTNSKQRCCNLPSRGARASTANQKLRSGAMLSSGVGGGQKRTTESSTTTKCSWRSTQLARGDVQHTDGPDHDEQ